MSGRLELQKTIFHDWIRHIARRSDWHPKFVGTCPPTEDKTDIEWLLAVVSIPVFILWKVRIKLRQKLGIAIFLCLSACIIVVASVRFSGTHTHQNIVQSWQYFWLEVEACIAVCMVSLSAFRSVFASDERRARSKKVRPWYSSTVAKLRERDKLSDSSHDLKNLPTIPSATLSGMRTFLRSSGLGLETEIHDESNDRKSLTGGQIYV